MIFKPSPPSIDDVASLPLEVEVNVIVSLPDPVFMTIPGLAFTAPLIAVPFPAPAEIF